MKSLLQAIIVSASFVLSAHAPAATVSGGIQWVKANGVHLRYELSGKGPGTVVLLHEMGTSLETWDYVLPEIARNHRVLRYDLRGFGLSQRVRSPLTMEDEMGDLRGLLETLEIRGKVTLIGGAVGGAIALSYAAAHPEQVKAVVAISPAAYMQARMSANGAPQATPPIGAPPASGASPQGPGQPQGPGAQQQSEAERIAQGYPESLQKTHPKEFAHFLAIQAAADPAATTATTPAAYRVSYSEVLPKIKCPALIVATSLWMRPPESFKELADAIPGGRFVVLETGHYASLASPELVAPVLTKFLKDTQ